MIEIQFSKHYGSVTYCCFIVLLVRAPTPDCRTFLADGLGTTGLCHCHGNKVNES